jgi:hypothetical protein
MKKIRRRHPERVISGKIVASFSWSSHQPAGSPLDSLKILQQSASNMFSYPEWPPVHEQIQYETRRRGGWISTWRDFKIMWAPKPLLLAICLRPANAHQPVFEPLKPLRRLSVLSRSLHKKNRRLEWLEGMPSASLTYLGKPWCLNTE